MLTFLPSNVLSACTRLTCRDSKQLILAVLLAFTFMSTPAFSAVEDAECALSQIHPECIKTQNCKLGTCGDNGECSADGSLSASDADCVRIYGDTCANLATLGLPQSCNATAVCGNGYVEDKEECDDGNVVDGDGCSSICQLEAECTVNADCDDGAFCNGAETCNAGECVAGNPPACDDGAFCNGTETCNEVTDSCDAGTPIDCSGSNDECNLGICNEGTDACEATDPRPAGTSCGDQSNTECSNPDSCDGAGVCLDNDEVSGASCGDAGTECIVQDTCDGSGSCTDNGFVAEATACGDSSDTECTNPNSCDGAGVCLDNDEADGTFCGDDGTECIVQDTCEAGACADKGFEPVATACGSDSDTECTNPDSCDGAGVCLDNDEASGTACGDDATECIVQDTCDGSGTCTDNGFEIADTPCGDDGTECIVQDTCDGSGTCDDNGFYDPGTECGDRTVTECTYADSCDGAGECLFNNKPCGSVTSSSLCEIEAFNLLFSPDMKNWVAYRLDGSNPGQTYYNLIYDASGVTGPVTLGVQIPYPYVTVGGRPLHVYDAEMVGSNGGGCLAPESALFAGNLQITNEDWLIGATEPANFNLDCQKVLVPGGAGFCDFDVTIPAGAIPASKLLYVNVHLDYGLKGPRLDLNPDDGTDDRYDPSDDISLCGGSDALEDTGDDDGELAIADCTTYQFSHYRGINPVGTDSVENLNIFKKVATVGAFGRVYCDGSAISGELKLQRVDTPSTPVFTTQIDGAGYYAMAYRHKGKPTDYQIEWTDGGDFHTTEPFELKSNSLVEIDMVAELPCTDFDGDSDASDWIPIEPVYGSGKFKNK